MGCASSTPMVATAGSEMLKAATHVAGDVKQQGEAAVEEASKALSSTLDTAKETVSTAVAGITNELGSAFKEGSEALDEAKHKVMEGLHLESAAETSTSRAPTPTLDPDGDSLKTSTPEPEIERALANEEEAPPTPKPSLQEMAELSAQVSDASVVTVVEATTTTTTTTTAVTTVESGAHAAEAAAAVDKNRWKHKAGNEEEEELPRPSTTEWERLADQLAKSRKFRPYESFARNKNQFSVYKDFTSLRDKPGHYDGHFSDGTSLSSTSRSQSDLSSGQPTPAPPRRHGQRDYAKFVGAEQAASVSRSSSRLSNVRSFDYNPQRERLPVGSRVGSRATSPRRSLWARGQGTEAVLAEEPVRYSPVRRSSLVAGLRSAADRQLLPISRSSSNLQPHWAHRSEREEPQLSTSRASSRRPSDLGQREPETMASMERLVGAQSFVSLAEVVGAALPAKEPKQQDKSQQAKPQLGKSQLGESLKSMLDSSRDISSALLLGTPLPLTSTQHSLSPGQQAAKVPTPKMTRAATFVAEPNATRAVTHATPQKTPTKETTTTTTTLPISTRSFMADVTGTEHPPRALPKSVTETPRRQPQVEASSPRGAAPLPVSKSPTASRASSRLSSNSSSTEVVIRALSQLNTPRAVSQSPDEVVVTEYNESDLEAALAQLAGRQGSTTASLQSLRSTRRSSNNSRRTSPWLRRNMEHGSCAEPKAYSSCLDISSPARGSFQQLETCEICCNEFVMQ